MDTGAPLLRGTTVVLSGEKKWVSFKYEKCPDFCYCCGVIGHMEKNCYVTSQPKVREFQQYGSWLRADKAGQAAKPSNQNGEPAGNSDLNPQNQIRLGREKERLEIRRNVLIQESSIGGEGGRSNDEGVVEIEPDLNKADNGELQNCIIEDSGVSREEVGPNKQVEYVNMNGESASLNDAGTNVLRDHVGKIQTDRIEHHMI